MGEDSGKEYHSNVSFNPDKISRLRQGNRTSMRGNNYFIQLFTYT